MKNIILIFLSGAMIFSCASNETMETTVVDQDDSIEQRNTLEEKSIDENVSRETITSNFSDVINKEWNLAEVYINGTDTQFRRSDLSNEMVTYFTVMFDGQNLSGAGAPNRYSAPYSLGENQAISIMLLRSTLMAAIFEPEKLKEHDFYTYMQNANKWSVINGKLEILSKTTDNLEVRLVFSL